MSVKRYVSGGIPFVLASDYDNLLVTQANVLSENAELKKLIADFGGNQAAALMEIMALKKQLAEVRNKALEEAGELAYAYLADRGLKYAGGCNHADRLMREILDLAPPTKGSES